MCVIIHVPRQTSGGKLSTEVKMSSISSWLKFAKFLQSVTLAMQSMYYYAAGWPIAHFYLLVKTKFHLLDKCQFGPCVLYICSS